MSQATDISYERNHVHQQFRNWSLIKNNACIKLGEIHELLDEAMSELEHFFGQPAIEVIQEFGESLSSWFDLWDCSPESQRMRAAVEYSYDDLEEDMQHIEELIDELGSDFRFADL